MKKICVALFMGELRESLPKDVVYGAPIVSIIGRMELSVENYRGIIEYNDNLIRIQTKKGQIRIRGKRLIISCYTCDEMKITGRIDAVEYC